MEKRLYLKGINLNKSKYCIAKIKKIIYNIAWYEISYVCMENNFR